MLKKDKFTEKSLINDAVDESTKKKINIKKIIKAVLAVFAGLVGLYFIVCIALFFFEPLSYEAPEPEEYEEILKLYNYFDKSNNEEFYIKQITTDDIVESEVDKSIFYVADTVNLVSKSGASYTDVEKVVKDFDASICGYIKDVNYYQIEFNTNHTYQELLGICETMSDNDMFLIAFPDFFDMYTLSAFDDESENSDIAEDAVEYDFHSCYDVINAQEAWDIYSQYDNSVSIGLVDFPVDYNHPALDIANSEEYSTDFLYSSPYRMSFHGTHVAGIMCSDRNSDAPGMAENAVVYSYNSVNISRSYFIASICDMLLNKDVKVINTSLGYDDWIYISANLGDEKALEFIEKENILFGTILSNVVDCGKEFVICTGAGNSEEYTVYRTFFDYFAYGPKKILSALDFYKLFDAKKLEYVDAKYAYTYTNTGIDKADDRILIVGSVYTGEATDDSYNVGISKEGIMFSYFSCRGEAVDIAAPGEYIYNASLDNGYIHSDGTSMSTPFVSGTAAMMFTVNPNLTGKEVKDILVSSYTMTVTTDEGFTYPILNAGKAVKAAVEAE